MFQYQNRVTGETFTTSQKRRYREPWFLVGEDVVVEKPEVHRGTITSEFLSSSKAKKPSEAKTIEVPDGEPQYFLTSVS